MWTVKKLVIRERTAVVSTEKLIPQESETKTEIECHGGKQVYRKIEPWQRKRETERDKRGGSGGGGETSFRTSQSA